MDLETKVCGEICISFQSARPPTPGSAYDIYLQDWQWFSNQSIFHSASILFVYLVSAVGDMVNILPRVMVTWPNIQYLHPGQLHLVFYCSSIQTYAFQPSFLATLTPLVHSNMYCTYFGPYVSSFKYGVPLIFGLF